MHPNITAESAINRDILARIERGERTPQPSKSGLHPKRKKKQRMKSYSLPIDHQLVKSATTRAFVCSACGKVCVSYEAQTEPCPKLSVK